MCRNGIYLELLLDYRSHIPYFVARGGFEPPILSVMFLRPLTTKVSRNLELYDRARSIVLHIYLPINSGQGRTWTRNLECIRIYICVTPAWISLWQLEHTNIHLSTSTLRDSKDLVPPEILKSFYVGSKWWKSNAS